MLYFNEFCRPPLGRTSGSVREGADDVDDNALDPQEAHDAAQQWAEWASFDLEHFVAPLAVATGMTRQEVLLYLISERLGQLVDQGLKVKGTIKHQHEVKPLEPPPDPGEEWKA